MADVYEENAPIGAATSGRKNELTMVEALTILGRNKGVLIVIPLVIAVATYAASMLIAPTFTAVTRILPPQQQQSLASSVLQSIGSLGGIAGAAGGLKNPTDQYISFLKSASVEDALIKEFDLKKRYDQTYVVDARGALEKRTRISSGKDNIITIEVDDNHPETSASIANEYVVQLSKLLSRLSVTEAQQRREFFGSQLQATKINLNKAEQALASSGVSVATLNASPMTAVESTARLQAQINVQEIRISSLKSYLAPSAPELRQADAELAALRNQLQRASSLQPASSDRGSDYVGKYREFKYQENLFDLFARQFELAKIDESREGSIVQVIDKAEVPEKKSGPRKALYTIFAWFASMAVLIIFVIVKSSLANSRSDGASSRKIDDLKKAWSTSRRRDS